MTTMAMVARKSGGWLPTLGAAALIDSVVTLALPIVLGRAVDTIISKHHSAWWLGSAVVLIMIGVACDVVYAYAGPASVAHSAAWLRGSVLRQVLAIGPSRAQRFDTGDLVSRVSGNATEAAQAGPSLVTAFTAALPPLGSVVMLAYLDLWMAAALLVSLGLVALALWTFTQQSSAIITAYQGVQARIASRLSESLDGARSIAAAGTLQEEQQRVLQPLGELRGHGVRTWRVLARTSGQVAVVGPFAMVAVLAVGGLALLDGRISPGDLFAASRYAALGAGLGALTGGFARLARSRAGVGRAAEVLRRPPVRYGRRPLPYGPGALEFRAVTVRAGGATLLREVSLTVPGGSTVAVVGRSGAGKSVFAETAARLRDPDAGEVLLDGAPLRELSHEVLRAAVGCAFARPVLVGDTIADAISYQLGSAGARRAAQATRAHEFISRLPQGYDTALADAPMSGGEAQRLGLVRAWHANRLLVLDDATSSLDMVTEMQVMRALAADHGHRTRLIVTHRAAAAAQADLVVWLEDGRLRGVDSHQALWHSHDYREVFG